MRRLVAWGIAAVLAGCSPSSGRDAKRWTVRDFVAKAPTHDDLGGWHADELVSFEGQPIPFRSPPHGPVDVLQQAGFGLTVFPAYSEGLPASFAITEIWSAHPTPWVQPTWLLVKSFQPGFPASEGVAGTSSIFPLDVDSSFYSPFWRGTYVLAPDATPETYTSARAVLDAKLPTQEGGVLYCPIAPEGGGLAVGQGELGPVHPWVLASDVGRDGAAPLSIRSVGHRSAWVEGHEVSYLGVGANYVEASDQLPEESTLYTFVAPAADGAPALLPIPAVLPPEPFRSAFVRRTDVLLPQEAAVFVPADRAALATALASAGVKVVSPEVDPSTARLRLGSVIADTTCLSADAGLDGCAFLDSAGAIDGLSQSLVSRTDTTLAIVVTQVGARTSP